MGAQFLNYTHEPIYAAFERTYFLEKVAVTTTKLVCRQSIFRCNQLGAEHFFQVQKSKFLKNLTLNRPLGYIRQSHDSRVVLVVGCSSGGWY